MVWKPKPGAMSQPKILSRLLTGFYRPKLPINISNYYVIYSINDGLLTVTVVAVGNRKDMYS